MNVEELRTMLQNYPADLRMVVHGFSGLEDPMVVRSAFIEAGAREEVFQDTATTERVLVIERRPQVPIADPEDVVVPVEDDGVTDKGTEGAESSENGTVNKEGDQDDK